MAVRITVYEPEIGQNRTLISHKEGPGACPAYRGRVGYVWLGSLYLPAEIFRRTNGGIRSQRSYMRRKTALFPGLLNGLPPVLRSTVTGRFQPKAKVQVLNY